MCSFITSPPSLKRPGGSGGGWAGLVQTVAARETVARLVPTGYEVRSRNQRYGPMNFDSQHSATRLLDAVFSKYLLPNHRLLKELLTSPKSLAQIVDHENALQQWGFSVKPSGEPVFYEECFRKPSHTARSGSSA